MNQDLKGDFAAIRFGLWAGLVCAGLIAVISKPELLIQFVHLFI